MHLKIVEFPQPDRNGDIVGYESVERNFNDLNCIYTDYEYKQVGRIPSRDIVKQYIETYFLIIKKAVELNVIPSKIMKTKYENQKKEQGIKLDELLIQIRSIEKNSISSSIINFGNE